MELRNYKVLIPIDFSENSRYAIQYVLERLCGGLTHLYLLHAYKENTPGSAPLISLIDILREKSERLLQQEIKFIKSLAPKEEIEIVAYSRFGGYLPSIIEITKQDHIDLVVIGTNGHTHPRMDLRDDDPGYLVHRLGLPLLLVPKIAN